MNQRGVAISIAVTQAEFFELIRLREAVFVLEQGVPLEIELDEADGHAIHFIARKGDAVVGTARLVVNGTTGKIGRMAVAKAYRNQGVGRALLAAIRDRAQALRLTRLVLHAQRQAEGFYHKMGFYPNNREFLEAGIPHIHMKIEL